MTARRAVIEVAPAGTDPRARAPHVLVLRATNGAAIAHSRPYTSRRNALRGADAWVEAMRGVLHFGALGTVWPPEPPRITTTTTPRGSE